VIKPGSIDALMEEKVDLAYADSTDCNSTDYQLFGPRIEAIIDQLCCIVVFGSKGALEDGVPQKKISVLLEEAFDRTRNWRRNLCSFGRIT
jgi:hypothetical protein